MTIPHLPPKPGCQVKVIGAGEQVTEVDIDQKLTYCRPTTNRNKLLLRCCRDLSSSGADRVDGAPAHAPQSVAQFLLQRTIVRDVQLICVVIIIRKSVGK